MISEAKFDGSFLVGQFLIEGFCEPYRLGRNAKGRGILFYVRGDIPLNVITVNINLTKTFHVGLNLRNNKLLSKSFNLC